jgi:hypothetical protein
MSEQNNNKNNDFCDNCADNRANNHIDNIQEFASQFKNQEMKTWFNKILDDFIERNILQITNVDTNKEQIVDCIISTIPKSQKIHIDTKDAIVCAPFELAAHSPVIREYLTCERDVTQPLKIDVTSEAMEALLAILFGYSLSYKNEMSDCMNREVSYLINYLMIGQSDITNNPKIHGLFFKREYFYEHRCNYITYICIKLIFMTNDIKHIIEFAPRNFCERNPGYADCATRFKVTYTNNDFSYGSNTQTENCYIDGKSLNDSINVADKKFDQSFKTLITHENDGFKRISADDECLNIDKCDKVKMKKYFACLLQDLMKNNCAKLSVYLQIDLLMLCKIILCCNWSHAWI